MDKVCIRTKNTKREFQQQDVGSDNDQNDRKLVFEVAFLTGLTKKKVLLSYATIAPGSV